MPTVIETTKLTKSYSGVPALDNLDLTVEKGEVLGCLGPNGAGKTTTIRLLLGLIKPTSGKGSIFGLDCSSDVREIHKRLAYVPGEAALWPSLTGAETLHILGKLHGKIDENYQKELIKKFDFDPNKKVRTYSKGNRQKIILIAALATRAELLIMDEPTAGLDPIMEKTFRECVGEAKANGQTIFLSSHILEEVEALCDKVALLRRGKLIESGTLTQMRHLSALSVEATFDRRPPDLSHVANVHAFHISGHSLYCQVQGSIEPLLIELAKAKPKTLISREPSLEELFLSLYGDDQKKAK